MTVRAAAWIALATALVALPQPAAGKDKPGRKARGAAAAVPAATAGCKEPEPRDSDLVAGLTAYGAGNWAQAATSLGTWAQKPDAEKRDSYTTSAPVNAACAKVLSALI